MFFFKNQELQAARERKELRKLRDALIEAEELQSLGSVDFSDGKIFSASHDFSDVPMKGGRLSDVFFKVKQ